MAKSSKEESKKFGSLNFGKALDSAVFGNIPVFVATEVSEGIMSYIDTYALEGQEGQMFLYGMTPANTAGGMAKVITVKCLRLMTADFMTPDSTLPCDRNLGQRLLNIKEGTYKAVAFRAVTAFAIGFTVSFAYRQGGMGLVPGGALFAVFDGVNAALYDATNELTKLKNVRTPKYNRDGKLVKIIVKNNANIREKASLVSGWSTTLFEGFDGLLKDGNFNGFVGGIMVDYLADGLKDKIIDPAFYKLLLPLLKKVSEVITTIGDKANYSPAHAPKQTRNHITARQQAQKVAEGRSCKNRRVISRGTIPTQRNSNFAATLTGERKQQSDKAKGQSRV
jgi:hypothetical protein